MCYKPYMRKWMSDRLKRRKKPQEAKPSEPAQAPLQPAYFEADSAPAETVTQPAPEPEADAGSLESSEPQEAPAAAHAAEGGMLQTGQNRPRRRRTRGGRGRGGQRTGPARSGVQPAPPVAVPAEIPRPAAAPAQEPPAAPPRPPKGSVILAIGLPGSGKSSWFKRNNITPLSSDPTRSMVEMSRVHPPCTFVGVARPKTGPCPTAFAVSANAISTTPSPMARLQMYTRFLNSLPMECSALTRTWRATQFPRTGVLCRRC